MKKILNYIHNDLYFEIICFVILVLSFCLGDIRELFLGYVDILLSPGHLLTDFVYIGGVGATLFNVATVLMVNLAFVRILKVKMSGPIYSTLYIILGFSFFGKTLLNILPVYLGVWLFSKYKKMSVKPLVISLLLSSGISPVVSLLIFGVGLPLYVGIPLGILCGVIAGFIIPSFSAHTITFHEGYNLYNSGFAIGVICILFYAIFKAFGLNVAVQKSYNAETSYVLMWLIISLCVASILAAVIGEHDVFKKWFNLHKSTGRLMTDFIRESSVETVLLNFGIIGLFLTGLCLIFKVPFNGLIFGSLIANIGLAGFGLHLRNGLPVWVGCILSVVIQKLIGGNLSINYETEISTVMAILFASCLAPISGKYGIVYGLLGGFIHMCVAPISILITGGINLYNNGFAAGFEASVLVVCGENVFNKERKFNNAKK